MKCPEALERILEADLEELLEEATSPLTAHLGACPRCSGIARRILEEERALGADLISATPALDLDLLLVQAGVRKASTDSVGSRDEGHARAEMGHVTSLRADVRALSPVGRGPAPARGQSKWARLRWGRAILPLAAAAAAVSLLLPNSRSLPGDPYSPPEPAAGLDLQVPEGSSAAVLETQDPNITVLWLF